MRQVHRARRHAALAFALALVGPLALAAPAAAADPTTTLLEFDPGPHTPDEDIQFHIFVDGTWYASNPYPQGSVELWVTDNGTDTKIGTWALNPSSPGDASVSVMPGAMFGAGTHHLYAKYIGPDPDRLGSTSDTEDLVVDKFTAETYLSLQTNGGIETGQSFVLGAIVISDGGLLVDDEGATITFYKVGSNTPICSLTFTQSILTECTVPGQPVGTSSFRAIYSGNSQVAGMPSMDLAVPIGANTVHATGVGVDSTTIYPVTDAYKDKVYAKGTRDEPISVSIRIYNPGGTLIRTITLAQGTGAYAASWNGRNSAGTILPEGKYKFVQTLKDGPGATKVVTSYVTLSKKRMYTYTKTISKNGSSLNAKGTIGGSVTTNSTAGYAKLYAPGLFENWAGAGWELSLPAASVYKNVYVRIYGRHSGSDGATDLGAQNFSWCARSTTQAWSEDCFGSWAFVPTTSGTTLHYYRTASLSSQYRSAGKVRLMVSTYGGTTWVYKAQVVVTYGILKY